MMRPASASGFTMIEMIAVMAIMIVLMSIGLVGFLDFKKDAAIRSSTLGVKTGIAQARQVAITYRKNAYFRYGNSDASLSGVFNGYYVVSTNRVGGDVSPTNWMAQGIVFGDPSSPGQGVKAFTEDIRFKYDGSCGGVADFEILIVDRERQDAQRGENAMTNFSRLFVNSEASLPYC